MQSPRCLKTPLCGTYPEGIIGPRGLGDEQALTTHASDRANQLAKLFPKRVAEPPIRQK